MFSSCVRSLPRNRKDAGETSRASPATAVFLSRLSWRYDIDRGLVGLLCWWGVRHEKVVSRAGVSSPFDSIRFD